MTKHLPINVLGEIYSSISWRFIVYSAAGYAVAMMFGYAYYNITGAGGTMWWQNPDFYPHCAGLAYGFVIGFFAVRDGMEANRKLLSEGFAAQA